MKKASLLALAAAFIAGILVYLCLAEGPLARAQQGSAGVAQTPKPAAVTKEFPAGAGTPSSECGECHRAIFLEYAYGFGSDLVYRPIAYQSAKEALLKPSGRMLAPGSGHSFAGKDPWPAHARDVEAGGKSCNVCHYPEPFDLPDLEKPEIERPKGRPLGKEDLGITCASCHLTPDGKIRGPYGAAAPHETVKEPRIRTSAMCAHCHAAGKRVVGKQTQTFLEWREDFHKPGLGTQNCQDCHMPRTVRKPVEEPDVRARTVARHLWTGGHSPQRISGALSLVMMAEGEPSSVLRFHLINIGAGHSVPTGSSRRAICLRAEVTDSTDSVVARQEWLFAPSYGDRPDDKAFLEQDKKLTDAVSATKADEQGPHETILQAGEERVLSWEPKLPPGQYVLRAMLVYDLNRYNDPHFQADQTIVSRRSLPFRAR
jgi:hypothetical protein